MPTYRAAGRNLPPYLDPSRGVEARVRDLLGRMTIQEKVRQMGMHRVTAFLDKRKQRVVTRKMREFFDGVSIGCLQDPRLDPRRSAESVNAVQKHLVEETRLGIPALVVSECLHGHLSGGATIFPQAIALGSTWDPDLVAQMSAAAAREARAVGVAQALAPDLDLSREPRWGRVEETYGEDPYLVSRMGVAYIRAMQGPGPDVTGDHLVCTPKHYAAHGSPEGGLNISPVPGGLRDLYMTYLPPFKAAVVEAGALSIMPAYSEYDGVPASKSALLLTRVLREEWGFPGYVFSDYGAIYMLVRTHRTALDAADAGRQALEAGMDVEAPSEWAFGEQLLDLVRKGEVSVDLVDRAVARVLRVKFLAGLFENPYADPERAVRIVNCDEHKALARRIAQESITLLTNGRGLLPLDPSIASLAVIGPNADAAQCGDYSQFKPEAITPFQGIRAAVSQETAVRYAKGCGLFERSREGFHEAVEAARRSDTAVVVIGGSSSVMGGVGWGSQGGVATCGEGFDRAELTPPGVQEDLVRAVIETGTPTVVVLMNGRPYGIEWIAGNAAAVVEAWYPGEQGGHALADVLFGKVNPSGRLPISFPRSVGHVPSYYNHKPSARGYYRKPGTPDAPGRDYVFSTPAPLFPFGHGLSYTTFKYSRLGVTPRRILPGGRVQVEVEVRNTGKRAGKEVVQLYVTDVVSSVTTPVRSLRRFAKVHIEPGEQKTVFFELTPDDLKLLDERMNWVVEPGRFEVAVGPLKKVFDVVVPR